MVLTLSRRHFLTGCATAVFGAGITEGAIGQTAPRSTDGFQLLRATPLEAASRDQAPSLSPTWGYAGVVPGPLLRARQGAELKIRMVNNLPEPTAIHWHGVRIPNAPGSVSQLAQATPSGHLRDYQFVPSDAGTFWYHAASALPGQLERGLFGALIVDEKIPAEVDRDVVLIFGPWPRPTETIAIMANERLRCRLVNATKSKVTRLRFDRHPIRVMAIDGQPAEPFLARDGRIALGPGNRIDVFVDAVLEPGATGSIFLDESGGEKEFARLVYDPAEKRRAAPLADPKPLPPNPLPDRIDLRNALRIEAPLGPDSQNPAWRKIAAPFGRFGSSLFSVKRGRAVVMAFPNQTDAAHVIHLHGHCARLLDNLDDGWKPFWLDTILVDARKTARIAFVADNPGQWLIERQAIGQDGAGLTAWFEVV